MTYISIHENTPIKVLKSVFDSFDEDHNGILDKDEFNTLLSVLGVEDKAAQDACQLLADKNGDGVISKDEFYEWIKEDKIQQLMNDSSKFRMLCGVAQVFKSFDVDGDNTISWQEFKDFMCGAEQAPLDEAKMLWHEIDTDNDGSITFQEYWHFTQTWHADPVDQKPNEQQYTDHKEQEEHQPYVPSPSPSPSPEEQNNEPQEYLSIAKAKSIKGADREKLLNDKDFVTVFGMTKNQFYELKKWKQTSLKKKTGFW
eukprot:260455_1